MGAPTESKRAPCTRDGASIRRQARSHRRSIYRRHSSAARPANIRSASAIRAKYGVNPEHIPDFLALVGDSADGYPGIQGIGTKTAAQLVNRYGQIENFPSNVLGSNLEMALLFKRLATLRSDLPLFRDVERLRWSGDSPAFEVWVERIGDARLMARVKELQAKRA